MDSLYFDYSSKGDQSLAYSGWKPLPLKAVTCASLDRKGWYLSLCVTTEVIELWDIRQMIVPMCAFGIPDYLKKKKLTCRSLTWSYDGSLLLASFNFLRSRNPETFFVGWNVKSQDYAFFYRFPFRVTNVSHFQNACTESNYFLLGINDKNSYYVFDTIGIVSEIIFEQNLIKLSEQVIQLSSSTENINFAYEVENENLIKPNSTAPFLVENSENSQSCWYLSKNDFLGFKNCLLSVNIIIEEKEGNNIKFELTRHTVINFEQIFRMSYDKISEILLVVSKEYDVLLISTKNSDFKILFNFVDYNKHHGYRVTTCGFLNENRENRILNKLRGYSWFNKTNYERFYEGEKEGIDKNGTTLLLGFIKKDLKYMTFSKGWNPFIGLWKINDISKWNDSNYQGKIQSLILPKGGLNKILLPSTGVNRENHNIFGIDKHGQIWSISNNLNFSTFAGPMFPAGYNLINKVITYYESEEELDFPVFLPNKNPFGSEEKTIEPSNQETKSDKEEKIILEVENEAEVIEENSGELFEENSAEQSLVNDLKIKVEEDTHIMKKQKLNDKTITTPPGFQDFDVGFPSCYKPMNNELTNKNIFFDYQYSLQILPWSTVNMVTTAGRKRRVIQEPSMDVEVFDGENEGFEIDPDIGIEGEEEKEKSNVGYNSSLLSFLPSANRVLSGDFISKLNRVKHSAHITESRLNDENHRFEVLKQIQKEAIESTLKDEEVKDERRKRKEEKLKQNQILRIEKQRLKDEDNLSSNIVDRVFYVLFHGLLKETLKNEIDIMNATSKENQV